MVTPVSPLAVVIGKLLPYLALAFAQLDRDPHLHGDPVSRADPRQRDAALRAVDDLSLFAFSRWASWCRRGRRRRWRRFRRAQVMLLPSFLLSGYFFPISSLPAWLRPFAYVLPATYYIKIARGIIIRGAGFVDLWHEVAALLLISAVLVAASTRAFKKTIS